MRFINRFLREQKEEKGVASLVEIIVIVAVLGILIAASIANYKGAKDRAQIRRCAAVLHNIRQALNMFRIDTTGSFPATSTITDFDTLYTQLSPYGLESSPEEEFKEFISYEGASNGYTLVVRARDTKGILLTATQTEIKCADGSKDYWDLCNKQ